MCIDSGKLGTYEKTRTINRRRIFNIQWW